jgi:hypothetical protein
MGYLYVVTAVLEGVRSHTAIVALMSPLEQKQLLRSSTCTLLMNLLSYASCGSSRAARTAESSLQCYSMLDAAVCSMRFDSYAMHPFDRTSFRICCAHCCP